MKNKARTTLVTAVNLVVMGLLSCSSSARATGEAASPTNSTSSWARDRLETMTLEEKIGQLIYPRSGGLFLSETDPELVELVEAARSGRIGGVVFFKGDPFETAALANRLQQSAPLPLLMASDYEWGTAMRVERASRFPVAMAIGAGGTEADMEFQAAVTAREARALGIHLVLNPVLDLNVDPRNSVINNRSFGEDPERAGRLAAAYIRRAQKLGVLTTAKHFPGHGPTAVDSHLSLPLVSLDRERLNNVELVPFRRAIEAGVAAVMPAHLLVTAYDKENPATLSPAILQGLLRKELGFDGLIVSDALNMGAARQMGWDGEVAVAAFRAGVDALLVPPDAKVAYDALLRAAGRGDIDESRLDRSVLRILQAKEALELHRRRTVDLNDLPRRLGRPEVSERIEEIAARTLTLVDNEGGLLPFISERPPTLFLVDFVLDGDGVIDPTPLADELEKRARHLTRLRLTPTSAATTLSRLDPLAAEAEVVIFASYARTRSLLGRGELGEEISAKLDELAASGRPLVFVSLGNPYVLTELSAARALIATYDGAPASQRALARALFGEVGFSGKLPVALSSAFPLGRGISIESRRMKLEIIRNPEEVGLSRAKLGDAVKVVAEAIEDGAAPGAVLLVARRGKIVLEQALGKLTYAEDAEPVTTDTLYDLASLTKVVATTTLTMMLTEQGKLDLDARVQDYLPEFRGEGKDRVTVKDLLAHSGGVLWWTDLYKRFEGRTPEEAREGYLRTIYEMPLDYPPRSKTSYSDLGILLLGEILERVSGRELEAMARQEIFEPLGMSEARFRPDASLRKRIAPTEKDDWRGRVVHGEVHDENAFGLGGVAPHAGLFATARDLAAFAQMMLNGGSYNGRRLLNAATIDRFTERAGLVPDSSRALGWDTPSEPSSSGVLFSAASFGHTGFTGTSIWIDPERELFAILLTNRVHPTRENRKIYETRPAFHDAVMRAITDMEVRPRPQAEPNP